MSDNTFVELTADGITSSQGVGDLNRMLQTLFTYIAGDGNALRVYNGYGVPEGKVVANAGSLYMREDGASDTTLYVKESGTGATGWTPLTGSILDYKVKASSGDVSPDYLDSKVKNSIEIDSDDLQLVGDQATPGNTKLYGTSSAGVKGWQNNNSITEQDAWKIAIVSNLIFNEGVQL